MTTAFALLFYAAAAVLVGGLAYRIAGYVRERSNVKAPPCDSSATMSH